MRYWHHFPVNGAPDKPARFHDCRLAHRSGRAHRVYFLLDRPPHFHRAVRPCHADMETRIDRHSIARVAPVGKSSLPFVHCEWKIAGKYNLVQLAAYAHRRYKTDRYAPYG